MPRDRADFAFNTPGVTRTLNLRIWNPLLCQLSYRRSIRGTSPRQLWSLTLDLVQRVLAKTRAEFLHASLHLLIDTALDTDACAVIEITTLRALEPHVFTVC